MEAPGCLLKVNKPLNLIDKSMSCRGWAGGIIHLMFQRERDILINGIESGLGGILARILMCDSDAVRQQLSSDNPLFEV